VKLGVIADIHGNDLALRAVLDDAARYQVDRWWVLGDLVLFGPRPAEVLEVLRGLPRVSMLQGNTDRYVLTGEQPAPHATAADAAASVDLVQRYGAMAAGIGWTRGVLDQAGTLEYLAALPARRTCGSRAVPPSWACTPHRTPTTAPASTLASPTSSSADCCPGAAPTWW